MNCGPRIAPDVLPSDELKRRLLHSITTAMNDDISKVGTDKRLRHMDRLDAMSAAAEFLEKYGSALCEDCPPVGYPTDKTRCAPCPRGGRLPEKESPACPSIPKK